MYQNESLCTYIIRVLIKTNFQDGISEIIEKFNVWSKPWGYRVPEGRVSRLRP